MAGLPVLAQDYSKSPFTQEKWLKPHEPFRIVGNLYYVGTDDLGSYLITTPKGHILINTGLVESLPGLKASIEKLGFKVTDIKILLTNQVHFDHVGGMAHIKSVSGAKLMVDEKDADVMADGGNSDYLYGGNGEGSMFEPVKPDRILHNRDTIKLGGMTLTMLHHPGHTKGSCSFLFNVKDGKRTYKVLIANAPTVLDETRPGMSTYPNIAEDYTYTLKDLRQQKFDIWLAAHTSQCNLSKKYNSANPYNPKAFIDPAGYKVMLANAQEQLDKLKSRK